MVEERAVMFSCQGESLIGIAHIPEKPASKGVLVVVGGPQYRVGSHRQFLLLARSLAQGGVPVFRFDYRGMGDSEGEIRDFEVITDDIRAAMDAFISEVGVKEVVLWGLCDAATAACFYAPTDRRVPHLVLLNPWVRSEEGEAKAYLKHYYLHRIFSRDFWQKLITGRFQPREAIRSLLEHSKKAFNAGARAPDESERLSKLSGRMADGLESFPGSALVILSGDDLTAAEFKDEIMGSLRWKALMAEKLDIKELPEADHTFSRRGWRDQVAEWTLGWVLKP
ncbi:MAG: hydrolase 1, exosortase A system-associated [Candidatus Polarisedimenticolaceae bacterium]|nr:hydrolase 1, exosortase A system-associated [Candidatus Polarisedimenticolaceae bacterium]